MQFLRFRRSIPSTKTLIFTLGLTLAFAVVGVGGLTTHRALAGDCVSNSIIYCGEPSASSFIAQVRKNDDKQGHHDLQAIFGHFGLEPASYDQFVKYARMGTAYKDGRIIVDGQTVATNAWSIGRNPQPNDRSYRINSTTYYATNNQDVFLSNSIPVMVLFDAKGVMQFAVLTACSNPITGTLVKPNYSCDLLKHSPVSGKQNTYTFTTAASAGNNASISKLVYNFGDGSSVATTTNPNTPVTHTFTQGGSFKVTVTVYVKLPGNQETTVSSGGCSWTVNVTLPSYDCTLLTATAADPSKYSYKFVVTGKAAGGAKLTSADFTFGDGTAEKGVTVQSNTASVTHSYAKSQAYTAKATLHVSLPDGKQTTVTTSGCTAAISAPVPFYRCVQLAGSFIDKDKYSYRFVATASYGNGAELVNGDFDFGDGKQATGVTSTDGGKTLVADHTYAGPGTYHISAVLHFTANGRAVDALTCKAYVTPTQPPTPECKPGIPVGSPACTPCEYDNSLPSDSPKCVAPTQELPNTGAGNTIALSAAAAVVGFMIYRQVLYRRHRLAFMAAERGTSPVLNQNAPMSDAPEARVGHSLRRRRPF